MSLLAVTEFSIRRSRATNESCVLLEVEQRKQVLSIFMERSEADALREANPIFGEFTTYALLCQAIGAFSAAVSRVTICDSHNAKDRFTFGGKVTLAVGNESIEVECRALDAVGVAIRSMSPIYIEESVMELAGVAFSHEAEATKNQPATVVEMNPYEPYKPDDLVRMASLEEMESRGVVVQMKVEGIRPPIMASSIMILDLSDKENHWRLPIWLPTPQADEISRVLQNVSSSAPHSLLSTIGGLFSPRICMAVIEDFQEEVFDTRLVFKTKDSYFALRCRPSDAILTALVAKAPIYARQAVLEKAGVVLAKGGKQHESKIKPPFWQFRRKTGD
jgi:bifunctional DNase/RNase